MKTTMRVIGLFVFCAAPVSAQFRLDDWSQALQPMPAGIHSKVQGPAPICSRTISDTEVDATGNGWKKTWDCQGSLTSETYYQAWVVHGPFSAKAGGGVYGGPPSNPHGQDMAGMKSVTGQFDQGKPIGVWHFTFSYPSYPNLNATLDLSNNGDWGVPSLWQFAAPSDPCLHNQPSYLEGGKLVNGLKDGPWFNTDCNGENWGWQGSYSKGKKEGVWRFYDRFLGTTYTVMHFWQTFVDDIPDGPFLMNWLGQWSQNNDVTLTVTGELENGSAPIGPIGGTACTLSITRPPSPSCGKLGGTWRFFGPNGHLKLFWPDGAPASEREVVDGSAEGTWKFYWNVGFPQASPYEVIYHAGVGGTPVYPPNPFKPNIQY
jgi:hypothetical protein